MRITLGKLRGIVRGEVVRALRESRRDDVFVFTDRLNGGYFIVDEEGYQYDTDKDGNLLNPDEDYYPMGKFANPGRGDNPGFFRTRDADDDYIEK